MDNETIFRALQKLSREVQAIKTSLDRIIELAFRGEEVTKAAVAHVLRKESTQKELAADYETIFYRHVTGQFVLICAALPDNAKDAEQLTHRRLINSREACSFCGLVENSYASIELVTAKDPIGRFIPGERVHPRCSLYWTRLKQIADKSAPARELLL